MFPIRDTIPTKKFPIINLSLIVVNVLVFIFQLVIQYNYGDEGLQTFFYDYGMVPAFFEGSGKPYHSLLTNIFLHGGWLHLIGNIWTLYIFGDNVEDRMGRWSYLAFYLCCGLLADGTHLFFNMGSEIPAIGASGAIAGVMGAYMFLFPRSKVLMLIPIFYIPFFFNIKAYLYLAYWFILQLVNGTVDFANGMDGAGVAFWAHVGGFVGGIALYRLFLDRNYLAPDKFTTYKYVPRRAFGREESNGYKPWSR